MSTAPSHQRSTSRHTTRRSVRAAEADDLAPGVDDPFGATS
jgi:hypothetical protein